MADDQVDGGIAHDLPRLLTRRRALALLGGVGLLAACGGGTPAGGRIPAEGAGPFPANGGPGPDVLARAGIVRRDIRTSTGGARGTAQGLPLTLRLTVLDVSDGGAPFEGAAVYVWQCDRSGDYSLYSPAAADEDYLRGVQVADRGGVVEFTSVFPGCYPGRWPHVHLEVYRALGDTTSGRGPVRTSQLALPRDACTRAYRATGYERSAVELEAVSLERDGVFADGHDRQLATTTESDDSWTAALVVRV